MDLGRNPHAMEELSQKQQARWARLERGDAMSNADMALLEEMKADGRAGTFGPVEEGAATALTRRGL